MGPTYEFPEIQNIEIEQGRYFTEKEYKTASNKVILGAKVAKELFPLENYLDKYVKIFGNKFQIIGVLKEEGDNPFNFLNYDEVIWLGYNTATRFINIKGQNRFNVGRILYVKAEVDQTLDELKDEITGVLRAAHRLKPREDNDFSLNELSMLTSMIDSVFGAVYFAGFLIGIFALCVGMFSVANIMFVSVRERTNIIGIKKALGAQKNAILSEFLIESIILCIIGGLAGLGLVILVLKVASTALPFELSVSPLYIVIGVGTSIVVGMIAGIIPALMAARMDPVEAIRSK
jgi:putative ABC transport system permease protein